MIDDKIIFNVIVFLIIQGKIHMLCIITIRIDFQCLKKYIHISPKRDFLTTFLSMGSKPHRIQRLGLQRFFTEKYFWLTIYALRNEKLI